MVMKHLVHTVLLCATLLARSAYARVGESLASMQSRLGPGTEMKAEPVVLKGATEYEFAQEKWKLRAAFVLASDRQWYCLRERYQVKGDGFSEADRATILRDEQSGSFWVDGAFGTSNHLWWRGDGATAQIASMGTEFTIEIPQAAAYESSFKPLGVALGAGVPAGGISAPAASGAPATPIAPTPTPMGVQAKALALKWGPWVGVAILIGVFITVKARKSEEGTQPSSLGN